MDHSRACTKILLPIFVMLLVTILITVISDSPAFGASLKTVAASPSGVKGNFTLLLYGGSYYDDVETAAFLDSEGDGYYLDLYEPDFNYKVIKGVPAKEAIAIAEKFVRFHPSYWRSQLSKIMDDKGKVIGYELRPLYYPITYGASDVLDINYFMKKGGRVKVTIRLIPHVERLRPPGGLGMGCGGGN
jgi:hypothetical protein